MCQKHHLRDLHSVVFNIRTFFVNCAHLETSHHILQADRSGQSQVVPVHISVLHTVTCQAVSQLTVTTSFHAHMALLLRTTLRCGSRNTSIPVSHQSVNHLKNADVSILTNNPNAGLIMSKQVSAFSTTGYLKLNVVECIF